MLKLGKKDTDEKNDEGGEDEKEAKVCKHSISAMLVAACLDVGKIMQY